MNYKRMFIVTLIVLIMLMISYIVMKVTSCNYTSDKTVDSKKDVTEVDVQEEEITVEDWNYWHAGLDIIDEIDGIQEYYYEGDIIPDGKTAKRFADLVLECTHRDHAQWKLLDIWFESEHEIWVVAYVRKTHPEDAAGEDIEMALSKKTGEVLKIWYGE